jgi:hypothetical protein
MQENNLRFSEIARRYVRRFGLRTIFNIDQVPSNALARYEIEFDPDEKSKDFCCLIGVELGRGEKKHKSLNDLFVNDQSLIFYLPQFQYSKENCSTYKECILGLVNTENDIILNFINDIIDTKLDINDLAKLKGKNLGLISVRQEMFIFKAENSFLGWADISIIINKKKLLKELNILDML